MNIEEYNNNGDKEPIIICLNHFQNKYKRPALQMKINYFGTPYLSTKTE